MPRHEATYLLGRELRAVSRAVAGCWRMVLTPFRRSFWRDLRQGWRDAGGG